MKSIKYILFLMLVPLFMASGFVSAWVGWKQEGPYKQDEPPANVAGPRPPNDVTRQQLEKQFDRDMARRQQQLAALKQRIADAEAALQKRKNNRESIIDLRWKMIQAEKEGLGWPKNQNANDPFTGGDRRLVNPLQRPPGDNRSSNQRKNPYNASPGLPGNDPLSSGPGRPNKNQGSQNDPFSAGPGQPNKNPGSQNDPFSGSNQREPNADPFGLPNQNNPVNDPAIGNQNRNPHNGPSGLGNPSLPPASNQRSQNEPGPQDKRVSPYLGDWGIILRDKDGTNPAGPHETIVIENDTVKIPGMLGTKVFSVDKRTVDDGSLALQLTEQSPKAHAAVMLCKRGKEANTLNINLISTNGEKFEWDVRRAENKPAPSENKTNPDSNSSRLPNDLITLLFGQWKVDKQKNEEYLGGEVNSLTMHFDSIHLRHKDSMSICKVSYFKVEDGKIRFVVTGPGKQPQLYSVSCKPGSEPNKMQITWSLPSGKGSTWQLTKLPNQNDQLPLAEKQQEEKFKALFGRWKITGSSNPETVRDSRDRFINLNADSVSLGEEKETVYTYKTKSIFVDGDQLKLELAKGNEEETLVIACKPGNKPDNMTIRWDYLNGNTTDLELTRAKESSVVTSSEKPAGDVDFSAIHGTWKLDKGPVPDGPFISEVIGLTIDSKMIHPIHPDYMSNIKVEAIESDDNKYTLKIPTTSQEYSPTVLKCALTDAGDKLTIDWTFSTGTTASWQLSRVTDENPITGHDHNFRKRDNVRFDEFVGKWHLYFKQGFDFKVDPIRSIEISNELVELQRKDTSTQCSINDIRINRDQLQLTLQPSDKKSEPITITAKRTSRTRATFELGFDNGGQREHTAILNTLPNNAASVTNTTFDDFVGTWDIQSKAYDVIEEDIVCHIEINDRFVEIQHQKSSGKYSYHDRNIQNGKLVLELESIGNKRDSLQITFERFENQSFAIKLKFGDTKTLEFAGQLRKDSSYTSKQKESKPQPSANFETKIHKAFIGRWNVTDDNGKKASLFHEIKTVAIGDESVLLSFKHGTFLYEIKSLEVAADYLTFNLVGRGIAHKLALKCEKDAATDAMKISLIRKIAKPITLKVSRSSDATLNAGAAIIPKSIEKLHADSTQQYLGRWQIQSDAESDGGPKYGFTSVEISSYSIHFPFTEPHDGAVRQTMKGFHITSLALTEDTLTFSSVHPETNQEVRIKCTRDTQNHSLLSMSVTNTEEVPKALALTRHR